MKRSFDDPEVAELIRVLHSGAASELDAWADRALADWRIVDDRRTVKTLLHTVTEWPGHHVEAAAKIARLAALGVPVDEPALKPTADSRETALHWAASADDVVAIDALLAAGADIEAPGGVFTRGAPLANAVVFRKRASAARLVERGAEQTAWQAAALGNLDVLEAALDTLDQEALDDALWHACRFGEAATSARLLEAGARPDVQGPLSQSAREVGLDSGSDAVVALLQGVDGGRTHIE